MVGRPPYPHMGAGQVGILVLVLVLVPLHLHLGLVPLHLHLALVLVLVPLHLHLVLVLVLVLALVPLHLHLGLVPLHLHLGLVPLHLHLPQQPFCAWHPCQRAALNTGSASTWTLGRPRMLLSRLQRPQRAPLPEPFSVASQPRFLYDRERPPHPVDLLVSAGLPLI